MILLTREFDIQTHQSRIIGTATELSNFYASEAEIRRPPGGVICLRSSQNRTRLIERSAQIDCTNKRRMTSQEEINVAPTLSTFAKIRLNLIESEFKSGSISKEAYEKQKAKVLGKQAVSTEKPASVEAPKLEPPVVEDSKENPPVGSPKVTPIVIVASVNEEETPKVARTLSPQNSQKRPLSTTRVAPECSLLSRDALFS